MKFTDKTEKKLHSRLSKAIKDYELIDDGDKILVGLSGGKDSLALVRLLSEKARVAKPRFSIVALHVRMKEISYESSTAYLEAFCRDCGVEFVTETVEIGGQDSDIRTSETSDIRNSRHPNSRKLKTPCFLCSWNRRKALFTKAQELGCNKIALGHHRDDIVHTAMLNIFFQGQFATMPAKLKMRKMPLTIIRPLCLIDEADLKEYAATNAFQKQSKLCPYEHDSQRTTMADIFRQIEYINPEARFSVMRALENAGKLIE